MEDDKKGMNGRVGGVLHDSGFEGHLERTLIPNYARSGIRQRRGLVMLDHLTNSFFEEPNGAIYHEFHALLHVYHSVCSSKITTTQRTLRTGVRPR